MCDVLKKEEDFDTIIKCRHRVRCVTHDSIDNGAKIIAELFSDKCSLTNIFQR